MPIIDRTPKMRDVIISEGDLVQGTSNGGEVRLPIGPVAGRIRRKIGENKLSWDVSPHFNVRDYGATGDGVTDDSVPIQAAIDDANAAGGGTVVFTPDIYKCNVTLKTGVVLAGVPGTHGYIPGLVNPVKLVAATAGAVIDTPVTTIYSAGVMGICVAGLGAGTAVKGIHFRAVNAGFIRDTHVYNTADEGILVDSATVAGQFARIQVVGCVLNRSRGAIIGAIDIHGTDHWATTIESTISGSIEGTVQSVNLYCDAIVWRASTSFLESVIGEISDIGINVVGDRNRFSNCRADNNFGHGWKITGGVNLFSNCLALDNSQDTTNTYSGFQTSGSQNQFANCNNGAGLTKKVKYGFEDTVQSDTNRNFYMNCVSTGAVTQQYLMQQTAGSAMAFASGTLKALTVNSATPDVTGYERWTTANSSPTTITSFLNGVQGQRLLIRGNDSNTTIQNNGSTLVTANGSDIKLIAGRWYEFVMSGGAFREIWDEAAQVSADVGDAAKTLITRRQETTQVWATPLAANRAVTLSTAGAYTGAKFRIVRTVASTGAFTLDVGTGPLKSLAVGQWCDVEYTGAAWMLTAYGAL